MQVHFDRRAEIAIRSLAPADQVHVTRVLSRLTNADETNWWQVVQAQTLRVLDGETLYSIRAGNDLRMLSKVIAGALVVQDVFPRQRLERIAGANL